MLRLCVFELLLAPKRFLGYDSSSSNNNSNSNSSSNSSSANSDSESASFDLVFLCPPYTEVVYGDLLKVGLALLLLLLLLLRLLVLLLLLLLLLAPTGMAGPPLPFVFLVFVSLL